MAVECSLAGSARLAVAKTSYFASELCTLVTGLSSARSLSPPRRKDTGVYNRGRFFQLAAVDALRIERSFNAHALGAGPS